MGSCISKCIPNKKLSKHEPKLEDDHYHQRDQFSHVQDKLVIISQTPQKATTQIPLPLVINPNKLMVSDPSRTPPSPSASTSSSSVSSFVTCATSKSSIGSSSISSSSSSSSASSLIGKDYKSSNFSNEFLWSCYKENPHISRINSLRETSKYYNNNNNVISSAAKPIVSTTKQTCPQKRVRPVSPSPPSSSSTLTRQKSFRRDHHHQPGQLYSRDNSNYYSKCSTPLRISSPSPSRRFASNGEKESDHSKRVTASSNSVGSNHSLSLFSRKENFRPCLRSSNSAREQRNVHRIGSKIDEIAVAEALACHEIDNVLMEDIDNPLISLDCFIFI